MEDSIVHSKGSADAVALTKSYFKHFEEQENSEYLSGIDRGALPWAGPKQEQTNALVDDADVIKELEKDLGMQEGALRNRQQELPKTRMIKSSKPLMSQFQLKGWAEDADGEQVRVCSHCRLPIGDVVYKRGEACVHGECMAQLMVGDLRSDEQSRILRDHAKNEKQHSVYGIGWEPAHVPINEKAASKLAMCDVPLGLVCLLLDESSHSIGIASTTEPAAAMNLEYLSLALQVRRTEGHEPIFSLDPVEVDNKNSMQAKVFVPEWLAGTSAGEVLFQADYHLKELSMGAHKQPVVGMKSCFEQSAMDYHDWSARSWFLVRKAEVHVSETGMLIPAVKMGVEAREQVVKGKSLEDKPVTRLDHPVVKFAEMFSQSFDLIAERKSVIFHLRELAKASVIAKYLLDSCTVLDETWFQLSGVGEVPCSLEVPQLWNERYHSQIHIGDGKVSEKRQTYKHSSYGGVRFGLDKFNLTAGTARPAAGIQAKLSQGLGPRMAPFARSITRAPAMSGAVMPLPPLGAVLSGDAQKVLGAGARFPRVPGYTAAESPYTHIRPGDPRLQGVDLRLDQFDLSAAKKIPSSTKKEDWNDEVKPIDQCVAVGSAFFCLLDDSDKFQEGEHCALLRDIFHPSLSDRRIEGDRFVPPDSSQSYVQKLRILVEEEEALRQRRIQAFCSEDFAMSKPGKLFPHAWTSSFDLVCENEPVLEGRPQGRLASCPQYKRYGHRLLGQLRASAPVFDQSTEEGLRFRIYRHGRLEVRTIQHFKGDETVAAVLVMCSNVVESFASQPEAPDWEGQKVAKARTYVERAFPTSNESKLNCRHYAVLETEANNKILIECAGNEVLSWIVDQEKVEARNSCAKLTRSSVCSAGVTVRDVLSQSAALVQLQRPTQSQKQLAKATFLHATGMSQSTSPKCLEDIQELLRFETAAEST